MNSIKKTFQYGAQTVTLETGEIARQASGAVMVSMGDTVVLVTAVGLKKGAEGRDFFPLQPLAGTPPSTATVAKLDEAFQKHALVAQNEESVYRGASDALDNLTPGDVIEDKGFVSTTRSPDVARQYAKVHDYAEGHSLHRSQQPQQPQFPADSPYNYLTGYSEAETKWRQSREVMVKIRVPRGARYLAGDSESAELILNRGSRFRVLRAGRDSDGRMAYEMELLP